MPGNVAERALRETRSRPASGAATPRRSVSNDGSRRVRATASSASGRSHVEPRRPRGCGCSRPPSRSRLRAMRRLGRCADCAAAAAGSRIASRHDAERRLFTVPHSFLRLAFCSRGSICAAARSHSVESMATSSAVDPGQVRAVVAEFGQRMQRVGGKAVTEFLVRHQAADHDFNPALHGRDFGKRSATAGRSRRIRLSNVFAVG